jgi:ABC-type multidrug transport system fused ATPase/permease subunit
LAIEYHAGQTGNAVLAQLPDLTTSIDQPTLALPIARTSIARPQSIRFEDVSFTYPGADQPVLRNVSFTIAAGETVVILGPSGDGKTTLLDLLHGRIQPTSGRITIDGVPLTEIESEDWLASITSVPQKPFMFSTSVHATVALSMQDASTDQIHGALDLARAADFVAELPFGIDSLIGEEGATLSGGQRQRLAIARAVLRDAPLVLLDEFTAHLDPATERDVIVSMRDFLKDRTAVIVAHREATLSLADRIFRIEQGNVVEVTR